MNGMRKKGKVGLLLKELYQLNTVLDLVWICGALIPKPETSEENYKPVSLLDIDFKILSKILAKQIQCRKRIIYHDQKKFIPEMVGLTSENKLV